MADTASPAVPRTVPFGLTASLAALLISFGVLLLGTFALAFLDRGLVTREPLLFSVASYQFLALGVAISALTLVLLRYRLGPEVLGFRLPAVGAFVSAVGAGVVAVVLGLAALEHIFQAVAPHFLRSNTQEIFGKAPHHLALGRELLVLLWAAVEAPLTEETLFRGLLFQGMRHFFARWFPAQLAVFGAALGSGLVFALAHGEIHTFPILALVGIVLAYVFQYTRSLFASGLLHALINAYAVVAYFGFP